MLIERRKELHERTAAAIESLYAARLEDRYAELAHHYGRAGDAAKAAHYLYLAGVQALERSAFSESLAHLTAGLEFLKTLPQSPARDAQEVQLQLELGAASTALNSPASDQTEAAFSRAYTRTAGSLSSAFPSVIAAGLYYLLRRTRVGAIIRAGVTTARW